MKRTLSLIILFAISFGNSVAQLILQSKRRPTLDKDVSNTLKTIWDKMDDFSSLETIPDWIIEQAFECAKHYQDFGVYFFHLKTGIYLLTLGSVALMFFWKKSGYKLYVLAQILMVLGVFLALGFNILSAALALLTAALSFLFIRLYQKLFIGAFTPEA